MGVTATATMKRRAMQVHQALAKGKAVFVTLWDGEQRVTETMNRYGVVYLRTEKYPTGWTGPHHIRNVRVEG